MRDVLAIQALWPGLLLALAGGGKLSEPPTESAAGVIAMRRWAPRFGTRLGWYVLASIELVVGVLVLSGFAWRVASAAAALLLGGAALTAAWASRNAPDADCGCFGAKSRARVSQPTVTRAAVLAAMALAATFGGSSWMDAASGVTLAIFLAEGLGLAALCPSCGSAADCIPIDRLGRTGARPSLPAG